MCHDYLQSLPFLSTPFFCRLETVIDFVIFVYCFAVFMLFYPFYHHVIFLICFGFVLHTATAIEAQTGNRQCGSGGWTKYTYTHDLRGVVIQQSPNQAANVASGAAKTLSRYESNEQVRGLARFDFDMATIPVETPPQELGKGVYCYFWLIVLTSRATDPFFQCFTSLD